jgi:glycosyltransferase involved in cell wall biosynthesis
MEKLKTLYICYFWLNESLVQTQVLPYLRELTKAGHEISLLTFEKDFSQNWDTAKIEDTKKRLAAEGIDWHCLPYHKWPSLPATLYDILNGARLVNKIVKEKDIKLLHARVHVPALMGAIVKAWQGGGLKLLFDIRGFMPEEYTDGGNWKPGGMLFHSVKRVEKWLLKKSDAFVVLTEKARDILFPESKGSGFDRYERPVAVIPCCVDLSKFESANEQSRAAIREKLGIGLRFAATYAGSLGTWYMADEMADLFQCVREKEKDAFALVLTQNDPEHMKERLRARGFGEKDMYVGKVSHLEIPAYLSAADLAVSFIKPCFSKLSSSPTKIAEYLAAGLPIVTNRGVGDVAEIVEADGTGAVVEDFSKESYLKSLAVIKELKLNGALPDVCRRSAKKRFDLEKVGGRLYQDLYKNISL